MTANLMLIIGTKLHNLHRYHTDRFTVSGILPVNCYHTKLNVCNCASNKQNCSWSLCVFMSCCHHLSSYQCVVSSSCCAAWLMIRDWNSNADWSLIGSDLKSQECSSCRQNRMRVYQKRVCSVCNMLLLLLMLLTAAACFFIVVILGHVVQMTQLTGSDMFSLTASAWEGHSYVIILH